MLTVVLPIALFGCVEGGVVTGPQGSSAAERTAAAITRPGAVAVDAPARRHELSAASMLHKCLEYAFPAFVVLDDSDAPKGYGLNDRYLRISEEFRRLGAACLRGGAGSFAAVKQYALDWARESKLGGPKGGKGQPLFWNSTLTVNMRLLSPMLSALGVAEQFEPLNLSERKILNRWIGRKVDQYEHGMRNEGYFRGRKDGTTTSSTARAGQATRRITHQWGTLQ
jgi:hypothetical protein